MEADISLSTSHILNIGGEKDSLSNMYFEILQESALHLKHYPGAVSWLQTAVAKMEVGKQASNPEIQFICSHFLFICIDTSFSGCEPRKP